MTVVVTTTDPYVQIKDGVPTQVDANTVTHEDAKWYEEKAGVLHVYAPSPKDSLPATEKGPHCHGIAVYARDSWRSAVVVADPEKDEYAVAEATEGLLFAKLPGWTQQKSQLLSAWIQCHEMEIDFSGTDPTDAQAMTHWLIDLASELGLVDSPQGDVVADPTGSASK